MLSPPARRIVLPFLTVTVTAILTVGFFPIALWTCFLTAAFRARMFLGYWPSSGHPDPDSLIGDFGPVHRWVELAVPLFVLTVLVGASLAVMTKRVPKRWWLWTAAILWFLAWGCSCGLFYGDPGGSVMWALD